MKSILYIIPYFGKLPNNFELYLKSCEYNTTVDWLLFTDDRTEYAFPSNVKVIYTSFEKIRDKIKALYDFEICLDEPYKICTYKPAYGEIFAEYIKEYDFWGHCDIDLIWGDIRKFYTDEVLTAYDKIGWRGHSTLYRNNSEINSRYRLEVNGQGLFYEEAKSKRVKGFDEEGMMRIYEDNGWDYYRKVDFAHPAATNYNFRLKHLPEDEEYKNKYQLFRWTNGRLYRIYVYNEALHQEEMMYIHFFRRLMDIEINTYDDDYIILPHMIINAGDVKLDIDYIVRNNRDSRIKYYCRLISDKRKLGKFKLKYIIPSLCARLGKMCSGVFRNKIGVL